MSKRQLNDSGNMIFVFMQEFGVTRGDQESPILKTIGAGPCVAVTLYDKESRVGAMVHLNSATLEGNNLEGAFLGMIASMRSAGYKDEDRSSVEVRIVGGNEEILSEELLEGIQKCLSSLRFSNIVETDPNLGGGDKRIALDTQTGELFDLVRIIPSHPSSEEERMTDRLRGVQAMFPWIHYTYDTRAKAYKTYVYESLGKADREFLQYV